MPSQGREPYLPSALCLQGNSGAIGALAGGATAPTRQATDSAAPAGRQRAPKHRALRGPAARVRGGAAAAAPVRPPECPPRRAGISLRRRRLRGAGEGLYLPAFLVLLSNKYTIFIFFLNIFSPRVWPTLCSSFYNSCSPLRQPRVHRNCCLYTDTDRGRKLSPYWALCAALSHPCLLPLENPYSSY